MTPNFAIAIEYYANLAILAIAAFLTLAALLHCAIQRPDSFAAAGRLTKGHWLAILAGCLVLSLLGFGGSAGAAGSSTLSIFGIIGLIAALVYLLDIRKALHSGGSHGW